MERQTSVATTARDDNGGSANWRRERNRFCCSGGTRQQAIPCSGSANTQLDDLGFEVPAAVDLVTSNGLGYRRLLPAP